MKKNTTSTTAKNTSHLLFDPERKVLDADTAQRMAAKCSDYNDSRSEARNFKCMEFTGVKFKGEDLSGIEAHYSKFVDCEFSECKLSRMEAYFAHFENCSFINCNVENASFSFAKLTGTVFSNCNLERAEFPFAQGDISCSGCMMGQVSAENANMKLTFSNVNAGCLEANFAALELNIENSNVRNAEFNDGWVKGKVARSDLNGSEFNRADLAELEIIDCATHNMETENSSGDLFDSTIEDALNELEEGILEE